MRAPVREHSFASIGRPSQPASPGLTSGLPRVVAGLSPIWPHSRAIVSTMRTIWVIFVLALITIAGEIYSDAIMTSSLIAPAAPDPVTVAVGHAAKPG
jgi:hypothetical protein